ncbi:uncharacterized protein LOC101852903 [Aplysia californica]|uniref:Uncharacterized protein LOC101852903 n=1 Tax=Aplysia californica TaxID=6500 RepID=A0ABM0ZUR0_APLCA|nr:uncharacterized protein LOC101852903 [Aplysia californica]
MSKDAIKIGRYTYSKRTQDTIELNKIRGGKSLTQVENNRASKFLGGDDSGSGSDGGKGSELSFSARQDHDSPSRVKSILSSGCYEKRNEGQSPLMRRHGTFVDSDFGKETHGKRIKQCFESGVNFEKLLESPKVSACSQDFTSDGRDLSTFLTNGNGHDLLGLLSSKQSEFAQSCRSTEDSDLWDKGCNQHPINLGITPTECHMAAQSRSPLLGEPSRTTAGVTGSPSLDLENIFKTTHSFGPLSSLLQNPGSIKGAEQSVRSPNEPFGNYGCAIDPSTRPSSDNAHFNHPASISGRAQNELESRFNSGDTFKSNELCPNRLDLTSVSSGINLGTKKTARACYTNRMFQENQELVQSNADDLLPLSRVLSESIAGGQDIFSDHAPIDSKLSPATAGFLEDISDCGENDHSVNVLFGQKPMAAKFTLPSFLLQSLSEKGISLVEIGSGVRLLEVLENELKQEAFSGKEFQPLSQLINAYKLSGQCEDVSVEIGPSIYCESKAAGAGKNLTYDGARNFGAQGQIKQDISGFPSVDDFIGSEDFDDDVIKDMGKVQEVIKLYEERKRAFINTGKWALGLDNDHDSGYDESLSSFRRRSSEEAADLSIKDFDSNSILESVLDTSPWQTPGSDCRSPSGKVLNVTACRPPNIAPGSPKLSGKSCAFSMSSLCDKIGTEPLDNIVKGSPPPKIQCPLIDPHFSESELDSIIEHLVNFHEENVIDNNGFNEEQMREKSDSFYHEYCLHEKTFGELKALDRNLYFEIYKSTGLDVDGRGRLIVNFLCGIHNELSAAIKFFKQIPGFRDLSIKDQIVLVKGCSHEFYILGLYRGWNDVTRLMTFIPLGVTMSEQDMRKMFTEKALARHIQMSTALQKLNMTFEQIVVFKAIVAVSPGEYLIHRPKVVMKIRDFINPS